MSEATGSFTVDVVHLIIKQHGRGLRVIPTSSITFRLKLARPQVNACVGSLISECAEHENRGVFYWDMMGDSSSRRNGARYVFDCIVAIQPRIYEWVSSTY